MTEFDEWLTKISSVWVEALRRVPLHLRDYNMCKKAVTLCGAALQCVPEDLRDYEMCLAAVTNDSAALLYVPNDLPGRELLEIMASTT
jgi:hypothetical protein